MADYKLPKCWLGKSQTVLDADGKMQGKMITEAEVNLQCRCLNEMQAFFCGEGHLTECHAGMSCEDAECSHYEREMRFEADIDLDDGDPVDNFDEEEDCS